MTFRDVWWNCLTIPSIVFTDRTWVHIFFWMSFLYLLISSTKITSSWRSYEFLTLVQYKRMFTLFEKATKMFSLLFFQICIHIWMGPDFIRWLQPAVAKSSTLTWKRIREFILDLIRVTMAGNTDLGYYQIPFFNMVTVSWLFYSTQKGKWSVKLFFRYFGGYMM